MSIARVTAALLLVLRLVPDVAAEPPTAEHPMESRATLPARHQATSGVGTSERRAGAHGSASTARALRLATDGAVEGSIGASARETTLDKGLRLMVEERPATETVAVRLVLLGGALDAPAERSSLAELHASLLVRSTLDHKADELSRAVEALGGRLSGGTSLRAETIAFDGPAESLEPAVKLLAEILLRPRFDAYELEKEKGLLAGSIAASHDEPSGDLIDQTYKDVFRRHPFSVLVRATEEEVRAVTIEEVRKFHEARFGPRRIVLIVVGHCTGADVERIAKAAFERLFLEEMVLTSAEDSRGLGEHGATEPRAIPVSVGVEAPGAYSIPAPAPLPADVRKGVHRRTTQAEIMIALPIDGIRDEDLPAWLLLRHILGGFQERLYTEIREKRGFAYWVALRGFTMPTAGWIGVHTGANKKNLPEVERVVRAELARIAKEPVGPDELDRARRYMTTAEARGDETNAGRAGALLGSLLDDRPLRRYEDNVARLASVTPEQIQDLARRLFADKHVAVVTLP